MEPKFQTSFIPKNPIVPGQSGIPVVKTHNILAVIATILFIITLLLSGGLFAYKRYLTQQIDQLTADLSKVQANLEPQKVQELVNANSRIISAKNLLNEHTAVAQLLVILQQLTVKNIQITKLAYINEEKIVISVGIVARSYNALAQQQKILTDNGFFKNIIFGSFDLDEKGNVSTIMSAEILPALVTYKDALTAAPNLTSPIDTIISTSTNTI